MEETPVMNWQPVFQFCPIFKSSLGSYATGEIYGKHGKSLKLDGLKKV
jgi:hypothetical protein